MNLPVDPWSKNFKFKAFEKVFSFIALLSLLIWRETDAKARSHPTLRSSGYGSRPATVVSCGGGSRHVVRPWKHILRFGRGLRRVEGLPGFRIELPNSARGGNKLLCLLHV